MSWRAQSHPPTSAAPLAGGSRHGGACSESSVEGHAARTAAWEIQQRLRWRAAGGQAIMRGSILAELTTT